MSIKITHSVVIIVPAAIRDAVNAAAEAHGHGPDNISVPLSADGGPATHYGNRTGASTGFLTELDEYPQAMKDASVIDIRAHEDRHGHFDAVLAANNLQRVSDELPE